MLGRGPKQEPIISPSGPVRSLPSAAWLPGTIARPTESPPSPRAREGACPVPGVSVCRRLPSSGSVSAGARLRLCRSGTAPACTSGRLAEARRPHRSPFTPPLFRARRPPRLDLRSAAPVELARAIRTVGPGPSEAWQPTLPDLLITEGATWWNERTAALETVPKDYDDAESLRAEALVGCNTSSASGISVIARRRGGSWRPTLLRRLISSATNWQRPRWSSCFPSAAGCAAARSSDYGVS